MPRERTWGTPGGRSKGYFFPRGPYRLPALALLLGLACFGAFVMVDEGGRWVSRLRTPLMPGRLIDKHATILSCEECHVPARGVSNFRCQRCHDESGPGRTTQVAHVGRHYARLVAGKDPDAQGQVQNLQCALCHVEHRGRDASLAAVSEGRCVDCHGARRRDAEGPRPVIADFRTHPEFRMLLEAGARKTPTEIEKGIQFSHAEHMGPVEKDLKKSQVLVTTRERLCEACHSLEAGGPQGHRDFVPVISEVHCLRCHKAELKMDPAPLQDLLAEGSIDPLTCGAVGVSCSEGDAVMSRITHRDPWLLHNVRKLRRELYPAEHAREYTDLLVRAAQLQRRLLLVEPLATLPTARLLARASSFRSDLALIAQRIETREKTPADASGGLDRLKEVGEAARAGGDPEAEDFLKRLQGLSGGGQPLSLEAFERQRDALLQVLDSLAAGDGATPGIKGRVAYLRLRLLALEPGEPPLAGLRRAQRDRQEDSDRADDETRLRGSGIVASRVPNGVAAVESALNETMMRLGELRELDTLPEARPEERKRKERALRALVGETDASGCAKCHVVQDGTFAPVVASRRVMTLSFFVHEPHLTTRPPPASTWERLLSKVRASAGTPSPPAQGAAILCSSCHSDMERSAKASELHIGSIVSCRECHNPRGQREDCELCHRYHPPLRL
jgi:hypothetical protein